METQTLFFKEKLIQDNDVELIFHKDYSHFYNIEDLPAVKYRLLNCQDLASKDFEDLDYHCDGVLVQTRDDDKLSVFEATDMGGRVFQIVCKKIIREDLEYQKQDYIDLLKEIIKQRDNEYQVTDRYHNRLESLKLFLQKEIDSKERKLNEATWLANEKRNFLEGELNVFKKVFDLLTQVNTSTS